MQTGVLPEVGLLKRASVTPVFKKGKPTPSDPDNYRPISLTCVACRLLESGERVNLLNHLLEYGVTNRNQHRFLSRESPTTQLLECYFDWNIALNEHSKLDIIYYYLDYAKAFDSVV